MKRIGFVVLNYKNYLDTIDCVSSVLSLDSFDLASIVIVDNCSPNDSFSYLNKFYDENESVHVIASGMNGGYSFGNNVGIKYLNSLGIYNCVIATSDTVILSKNIISVLNELSECNVGVIGPKVLNLNGHDRILCVQE